MKELYYCTKIDKNGNKLTSSYTTKQGATQYGKGCTVEVDIIKADFSDPSKLILGGPEMDGPLVRGLLKNNNPPVESTEKGQYVLWAKKKGVWHETIFDFPSYSAANSHMKATIAAYEAMAIVDNGLYDSNIEKIVEHPVETDLSVDRSL